MSTEYPAPPSGVSVWPPPPTSDDDNGRSRLRSMLENYKSVAGLARWVVGLQILVIVLEVGTALGWVITPPGKSGFGDYLTTISLFPSLVQGILSIIWAYRLYKNTLMLGVPGLRYTPGSVVAFYFIPLVNFVMPYLVLREVWQATSPDVEQAATGGNWRRAHVTPLLGVWWSLYILDIAGSIASAVYAMRSGPSQPVNLITEILSIGVHILGNLITLQLTSRQDARYAETMAVMAL